MQVGIVLDFQKKQRDRQIDFERRALKDLSLAKIEATIRDFFSTYMVLVPTAMQTVRDMCAEYAMEAYLMGSSMSRFGLFGEDRSQVYKRSEVLLEAMIEDFCSFWLFWIAAEDRKDGLYKACEQFLKTWWREGFDASLKRQRLKLK